MKLAIIGSRSFSDYNYLEKICNEFRKIENVDAVVSGGASGTDTLAEIWANKNNIRTKIFKADWKKYGNSAGVVRNKNIIKSADVVLAFWDNESRGTKHSIDLAIKFNKEIHIYHI